MVAAAIQECRAAGLDTFVYEAYRSQELQALYYARGRTIIPPVKPVTNAANNLYGWHGYGWRRTPRCGPGSQRVARGRATGLTTWCPPPWKAP